MNDFTILHLSDLHINGTGESLSRLMINLLEDIKEQMKPVNNIILVVTGDLIHQAKYEKYRKNVVTFFKKLEANIGDKIRDAYFVPGNHDREHKLLDNLIYSMYDGNSKTSEQFYLEYWQYAKIGYTEYLKLVNQLYEILNVKNTDSNTYGVRITKIEDKSICFISFDTSWSSKGGETDERNLNLGNFQIDQIYEQYQDKLKEGDPDLTIALGHHPIEWLKGKEETAIQAEVLSNNRLGVNVYICGHVHNRDVINWQNNRHSMTTLVSGIGWPDGSEKYPYVHVYSSYTFNIDLNSIDVYVRSSNENGQFRPDFRIYTTQIEEKNRKIVMPIDSIRTQAYFELGGVKGRSPKVCYITDEIIESIKSLTHLILKYQKCMILSLPGHKYDYFNLISDKNNIENIQKLEEFLFNGIQIDKNILEVKDTEKVYEIFETYLQKMCMNLAKILAGRCKNERIRVHFRIWNLEEDYTQLAMADSKMAEEGIQIKVQTWKELLKEAFEAEHPLVASINKEYCNESFEKNKGKDDESRKWKDFLTAIPFFDGNVYIEKDDMIGSIKKKRPYLTFGITIYDDEDRKLLYELDYIRIDEIIKELINDFVFYMPINMREFAEYKKNMKQKKKQKGEVRGK